MRPLNKLLKITHPVAGLVALATIALFWVSTALAELFASEATVIALKTAIPWGFTWLIPALALTGGSGFLAANGRRGRIIDAKIRRMPIIAGTGLLVLIPAALFLSAKARGGDFDAAFYTVQAIELVAGASNVVLLALSARDGFKVSGRFRRRATQVNSGPR